MSNPPELARRGFLLGRLEHAAPAADSPQPGDDGGTTHISSAVVTVRPERAAEIARAIAALPGTEIHAVQHSKIVVVLEGPDSGALGARLTEIALMDGVFSANMVFEQIESGAGQGGAS